MRFVLLYTAEWESNFVVFPRSSLANKNRGYDGGGGGVGGAVARMDKKMKKERRGMFS